ncbi:hypothetical protein CLV63_102278 [Murinocardiopsis flavida]|uniref:DUF6879 domain-containing protein n=1 Tax=Murinocardiopsis flavida TaxID=645275 RepID=A0A2P8DSG6_9ACTN|nr:DUF6879 family protein [Murinocardiopsis flavida]PSL00151.1 hypothetical protein CLV63_102278 [Murinocardiopsis flavida]
MSELISGDAFNELFRSYRHTAWRLETRTAYAKAEEDGPFRDWLSGKEPDLEWFKPWLRMLRAELPTGKRMERVRLIDDPPSDYLRWELWATPYNLGAGEDIRYLPRAHPIVAELPDHDFWVFDSRTVARFEYDGDRPLGVRMDDDPATVVTALAARDAAWHYALGYIEYMATMVE